MELQRAAWHHATWTLSDRVSKGHMASRHVVQQGLSFIGPRGIVPRGSAVLAFNSSSSGSPQLSHLVMQAQAMVPTVQRLAVHQLGKRNAAADALARDGVGGARQPSGRWRLQRRRACCRGAEVAVTWSSSFQGSPKGGEPYGTDGIGTVAVRGEGGGS